MFVPQPQSLSSEKLKSLIVKEKLFAKANQNDIGHNVNIGEKLRMEEEEFVL